MMRVSRVPVADSLSLANGNHKLIVQAPELASDCRAGQFAMVSPGRTSSVPAPLLKRALAVYRVSDQKVTFLLRVVGDGTAALAGLRPGDTVELVGPLGNGFELGEGAGMRYLVAGGIGIASFYLLAEELAQTNRPVCLVYGARTSADLVGIEDFEALGIPACVSTEDGSRGDEGLVLMALERACAQHGLGDARLDVCGPTAMMRAVAEWGVQRGIPAGISVENRMACGFGVCLGCTVKTAGGFRLACTHGPVFDAEGFVWEDGTVFQAPPRAGGGSGAVHG